MAGELNFYGDPEIHAGLTVVAKLLTTGVAPVQVGADIPCPEGLFPAAYHGDMPAVAADEYVVQFYDGVELLGQGTIFWDGTAEITDQVLQAALAALPSATDNATAVRTELTTELDRIDVDVSSREAETDAAARAAAAPGAVRTELAAELALIDASISSRSSHGPGDIIADPEYVITDQMVYVGNVLVSARVRVFPDAATYSSATLEAAGLEGAIRSYVMTATVEPGNPNVPAHWQKNIV